MEVAESFHFHTENLDFCGIAGVVDFLHMVSMCVSPSIEFTAKLSMVVPETTMLVCFSNVGTIKCTLVYIHKYSE